MRPLNSTNCTIRPGYQKLSFYEFWHLWTLLSRWVNWAIKKKEEQIFQARLKYGIRVDLTYKFLMARNLFWNEFNHTTHCVPIHFQIHNPRNFYIPIQTYKTMPPNEMIRLSILIKFRIRISGQIYRLIILRNFLMFNIISNNLDHLLISAVWNFCSNSW